MAADSGLLFQPAKTIKGGDVNNKCWTMCKSIPLLRHWKSLDLGLGRLQFWIPSTPGCVPFFSFSILYTYQVVPPQS